MPHHHHNDVMIQIIILVTAIINVPRSLHCCCWCNTFTDQMPFMSPNQQRQSAEGITQQINGIITTLHVN